MFACIFVPDFPVEAIVRAEPLLRERAVAVLEGKPPLTRVMALNEKARLLGMDAGITKLQAAVFAESEISAEKNFRLKASQIKSDGSPSELKAQPISGIYRRPEGGPRQETRFNQSFLNTTGKNFTRLSKPRQDLAILRQRSLEQETSTHAALLDVAHAFSPRVEDTDRDTLLLDLAGLERLYGAPAKMAGDLALRVAAVGIEANVAVAANPDAALHAARGFNGITVISQGNESRRLGVLPLQILLDAFEISTREKTGSKASAGERQKLREQMLDTLERWGVRDFRTLALLPEHALVSRLGKAGGQLRELARGEGMRTLVLCEPRSQFEEAMELESAVETLPPLSFLLNRLLEQLCARLETRALAAQELRLRLQLEERVADEQTTTIEELAGFLEGSHNVAGKPIFERSVRLPVSMRDSKVFLKLLQLELIAHPPGAPVTKIWITAQPAPPRSAQRGLFLPISPEAEKLEITLARISAIVGERRTGIARLLNSHRRESFRVDRFVVAADQTKQPPSPTLSEVKDSPPLAMRLLRPAWRLQVGLLEGRPHTLVATIRQKDREELQGKVLWSAGPWRSSGDWWTENMERESPCSGQPGPWDREEWDIAVVNSPDKNLEALGRNVAIYRIYRDLGTGHWFADASYD